MSVRCAAVVFAGAVLCAACGGGADAGDDYKPLWPTYARDTAPAPAAPVEAEPETGPPPVVLLLPSLSCAICYRATVKVLEENPGGLRRHEIDVPAGEVRLYPEDESYRPDSIIAALREAGYVARIKGRPAP